MVTFWVYGWQWEMMAVTRYALAHSAWTLALPSVALEFTERAAAGSLRGRGQRNAWAVHRCQSPPWLL